MKVTEKKQICIAGVIVVMVGVFLALQYLPTVKKAKAFSTSNLELVTANAKAAAKVNELPQLYEYIADAKERCRHYDLKIPKGRSHGIFLQTIATVMKEKGLSELVIQPGQESKFGTLSCIPFTLQCQGSTENIFEFFKSMEAFGRIVKVSYVGLKNSDKYDGHLIMQMEAKIFYRKQNDSAAK